MRKRNTVFHRKLKSAQEKIRVKYASLSLAKQISLIGAVLGIFSLFLPWVVHEQDEKSWNAFTTLAGNAGYVLLFVFIGQIFLTLSDSYKEKLKLYSDIDFKNHFLIVLAGIFAVILSAVVISFAVGLSFLSQYMNYGNGPIMCIVAGILVFFAGVVIRNQDKKNNSEIILQKLSENRKNKEKQNMELPF